MNGYLTAEQIAQLLKAINPSRVQRLDNLSHLAAYDVRAHLNRIIGFCRWSADLLDVTLLFEDVQLGVERTRKNGSTYKADIVSVGYRATLRLTVCAPDGTLLATYTESATGDASNFPVTKRADAHDFAIKTAESQALKRCAANLGDQFGLSLYGGGSMDALVKSTLVRPANGQTAQTAAGDVQEGVVVTPETAPEHSEPATPAAAPSPLAIQARTTLWKYAQQVGFTSPQELADQFAAWSGGAALGDADEQQVLGFLAELQRRNEPPAEKAASNGAVALP